MPKKSFGSIGENNKVSSDTVILSLLMYKNVTQTKIKQDAEGIQKISGVYLIILFFIK